MLTCFMNKIFVLDKPIIELKNDEKFYRHGKTYSIECILTAYPLPIVDWSTKTCNNYTACDDSPFEDTPVRSSDFCSKNLTFFSNLTS